jgi:integrase
MQIHKKELSYAWLQETIDKFWYPDKYSVTLFKFISEYIDKTDTRINPKTSRPVCYKMKREYERTFELLKDYAADQKITLDFKDINLDFYEGFTDYLQKKNLAKNTIGKKIQTLKIFLNAAQVEGVNHYSAFKSRNFVSVTEEADTIYLNEAELESIYKKDFSSAPHLDRIRDLFLVGCWTGCRFSDWNQITPENISEGMISIKQTKTGDPVKIPLHPVVRSILGKYDGRLPALISNQKFNDALKKVAEAAEINDTVTKRTTKGGTIKTKTFEKWELVTSHCARRSFATNQYKSGVPSITIMAVTGHRSEKAFLKYLRVTSTEHAKKMQEHWDQRYLKVV